ncbi:hypothetical protein EXD76_08775, partial [BEV proteobacterium]|nr:hypothetical protein [Candidatus Symbiopectobacterium sp. Chty_BC]
MRWNLCYWAIAANPIRNDHKKPRHLFGIGIYTSFIISAIMLLHDLNLSIGGIDARLNRRYQRLVKQH